MVGSAPKWTLDALELSPQRKKMPILVWGAPLRHLLFDLPRLPVDWIPDTFSACLLIPLQYYAMTIMERH
jgi:hypothetical protein